MTGDPNAVQIPAGIARLVESLADQGFTGVEYYAKHRHRTAIERVAARCRLLAFPLIVFDQTTIRGCMAADAAAGSPELRQAAGLMLSQLFGITLDRGHRLVASIERRGWQLTRRAE